MHVSLLRLLPGTCLSAQAASRYVPLCSDRLLYVLLFDFQTSNHVGHDFNMFRSQAGGACDCGDVTVMRSDG